MKGSIAKWGNSLALRLPKGLAADACLVEGTEIDLTIERGRLVVTPHHRLYSLDKLIADITPENLHTETDWGAPQGDEAW